MNFVQDTRTDGRQLQILTVIDHRSRSRPVLEAGGRMSGEVVSQVLDRVLGDQTGLHYITVDHGTEFQSRALEDWAYRRGVQLDFIDRSNPSKTPSLSRRNGQPP